ncbi:MAG: DUF3500 domain-containing protein [Planctomycetes bacterium]|nr:DUF3500 domain-containing protein [Planctomycetota bacterium]
MKKTLSCPDCEIGLPPFTRRDFLRTTGAVAAAAGPLSALAYAKETSEEKKAPETLVKSLYDALSEKQRQEVCFAWDYTEKERGLLRTRISNNWHITKPVINSNFFTAEQKGIIREIFEGIYSEEWIPQIEKQLQDDADGYGNAQNIAIFGKPGEDKFEFVMTGRHMTVRCDGNSAEHLAFGGPIFYGHAADGFYEGSKHPGNVFWPQALEANKVYEMLDGRERKAAEVAESPVEQRSGFRGKDGQFPGIPIRDLSADQKEQCQKVLKKLIEPYRQTDRDEVLSCLEAQGGLDACSLAFYTDHDIGNDRVWDNWRIEGPSFVWYFRGEPHVHVWVHVADDPSPKINA